MEQRSGGERLDEAEPDDPALLLRPFEAALNDPTGLLLGLENALSDSSEFAQKLEAAIEALGSKRGRQGAADALLAINYLDRSLTELAKTSGLAESDRLKLARTMGVARRVAIKMGST